MFGQQKPTIKKIICIKKKNCENVGNNEFPLKLNCEIFIHNLVKYFNSIFVLKI